MGDNREGWVANLEGWVANRGMGWY
jgi:hypothetical protein